jgi:hypothetical protein
MLMDVEVIIICGRMVEQKEQLLIRGRALRVEKAERKQILKFARKKRRDTSN